MKRDYFPPQYRRTYRCTKSGQTRAYGPTVRVYRVNYEEMPGGIMTAMEAERRDWKPQDLKPEESVLRDLKPVIGWVDHGEGDWADYRLTSIVQVSPGEWEITISAAYTD